MFSSRHASFPEPTRSQQIALGGLVGAIVAAAVWTLHDYLPALAWAGVFAIAVWPLYLRVRRRWPVHGRDVLVPLLFTAAVALLFVVPLVLLGVEIGREAHFFFQWVEGIRRNGIPVPDWIVRLPFGASPIAGWWQDNLSSANSASRLAARVNRAQVVDFSRQVGALVAHRTVLFGFMLLTLFFLFRDGAALVAQLQRASDRAFGARGERIGRQMIASVHGTVNGLVFVGLGEGALIGIGYAVAGVPHPTLFGAVTAVAAMLPFCAALVLAAAAALLLANGSALATALLVAFGLGVIFVADHFVRPVLIGGATRLPFLLVLLGILGGVECWGLLGLFLGPALMAAVTMLWREWTDDAAVEL